MRIRTVLDARPGVSKKYIWQTCLLAASWRHYMAAASPLDVLIIGEIPETVSKFLEALGVGLIPAQPHANDHISRTSNKLQGVAVDVGTEPVLLVDNDVCFVGDAKKLAMGTPPDVDVMASVAGNARVSDAQWEHIENQIGLKPLEYPWLALNDEFQSSLTGVLSRPRHALYLNGGVVWLRNPVAFGEMWARHIRLIAELFENHPLRDRNVCRSDQAGMATAIGVKGGFAMLPVEYNYRPHCFWMGRSRPDEVKIIHMTNMNMAGIDSLNTIEKMMRLFWKERVYQKIPHSPTDRRKALMDGADSILRKICVLISEYNLNKIVLREGNDSGFFNPSRIFRKA